MQGRRKPLRDTCDVLRESRKARRDELKIICFFVKAFSWSSFLCFIWDLFFISDECFEVEEQCQHVISEIEQVLGEPLQKYFW